ncbi:MAG TPA: hypothetical protein VLB80_03030 [Candidatus Babeliales bacterium]|nr:hypothetical protein [Candidatus Babeliales bacterium]
MNIKYISLFSLLCVASIVPVSPAVVALGLNGAIMSSAYLYDYLQYPLLSGEAGRTIFQPSFIDKAKMKRKRYSCSLDNLTSDLYVQYKNAYGQLLLNNNSDTALIFEDAEKAFFETAEGKLWFAYKKLIFGLDLKNFIDDSLITESIKNGKRILDEDVSKIVNYTLDDLAKEACSGKFKSTCESVRREYEQMIKDNAIFK